MRILLFVSSHCSHCPRATQVVKKTVSEYTEHKINLEKIRMKTARGKDLSIKYGIMSVPTTLILNKDGDETKRFVGAPSKDSLRNEIDKTLGLKKTFFDRILGR